MKSTREEKVANSGKARESMVYYLKFINYLFNYASE